MYAYNPSHLKDKERFCSSTNEVLTARPRSQRKAGQCQHNTPAEIVVARRGSPNRLVYTPSRPVHKTTPKTENEAAPPQKKRESGISREHEHATLTCRAERSHSFFVPRKLSSPHFVIPCCYALTHRCVVEAVALLRRVCGWLEGGNARRSAGTLHDVLGATTRDALLVP